MRVLALVLILVATSIASPSVGRTGTPVPPAPRAVIAGANLNSGLLQVDRVAGTIVDVAADRVLYLDAASSPALVVKNRATGGLTALPPVAGARVEFGWLTPGAVVLTATGGVPATRHVYEWSAGSALVDLGPTNTYGDPAVSGPFVIWGNLGSIYRRDLRTHTTIRVATAAVDRNDQVLANGDVVYWTGDGVSGKYKVMLYHDGATTTVARDPVLSDIFPVADGALTVYSTMAVIGSSSHSTWIHDQATNQDTRLSDPLFTDLDPGGNYETAGGWTAFLRPGVPIAQVWLRDPAGIARVVSDLGRTQPIGEARVLALTATGQVLYAVADVLYLGRPDQPPLVLAAGLGGWLTHRRWTVDNFVTVVSGRWNLAIGATLFELSDQPAVSVTVAVTGKGTVAVAPYGMACRTICTLSVPVGARLALTATADDPGWRLAGWSGACAAGGGNCEVTVGRDTPVGVSFEAADTSAPIVTAPVVSLPIGVRLSPGEPVQVPLLALWTTLGSDGLTAVHELQAARDGADFRPVDLTSTAAARARTTGVSAHQYQFRARATDTHANVGEWSNGVPFTVDTFAPTAVSYVGAWTFTSPPASWLGTAASTADPAATATITVTGRDIAIAARTERNLGSLAFYVDGQLRQVVPTAYAGASSTRIVAELPLGGGTHVVRISLASLGTGAIELQGLAVLR